jgi:AcrR family transcriptional regulator
MKALKNKRGETRERLLVAARSCLADEGYAGLSTRRVAARAGAPLSQIHYHFGSKRTWARRSVVEALGSGVRLPR